MTDAYHALPDVLTDEELDALVSGDEHAARAVSIDHPMAAFISEASDLATGVSVEPAPELLELFQVRASEPLPLAVVARRAPTLEPSATTVGSPQPLRPAAPYQPSLLTRVLTALQLAAPRPRAMFAGSTALVVLVLGVMAGGLALRDSNVVDEAGEVAIAPQQNQTTRSDASAVGPSAAEVTKESSTAAPVGPEGSGRAGGLAPETPGAEAPLSPDGPDAESATTVVESTMIDADEPAATTTTVTSAPEVSETAAPEPETTTTGSSGEEIIEVTTTKPDPVEGTTTTTAKATSTSIVMGDPETVVLNPGVAYRVPGGLAAGTYLGTKSGAECEVTIQRNIGGSIVVTPSASVLSFIVTEGDTVTTSVGCPTVYSTISGPISN